jgi:uncharacterized protein YdhG (YjbR/CyaY superfamily)
MEKTDIKNVEEYVAGFHPGTGKLIEKVRATIKAAAPGAEEVISYRMPAYKLNGILVYFAAYKNHIGFYPTSKGIEAFKSELTPYKWAKGSIQFRLDQPIPYKLIDRIVRYRVKENRQKIKSTKK